MAPGENEFDTPGLECFFQFWGLLSGQQTVVEPRHWLHLLGSVTGTQDVLLVGQGVQESVLFHAPATGPCQGHPGLLADRTRQCWGPALCLHPHFLFPPPGCVLRRDFSFT